VACLLPTQEARSESRLGKTPLVATSIFKTTFSKQNHPPIAHQHACFDFTCIRESPNVSSHQVRCELPLVRPTDLTGGF
jgi:hypothetical protein